MTVTHLLALHLGGVQDFIVQARRTRDLWSGSQLFCELAAVAAWHLKQVEGPGCLIFPPPAFLEGEDGDIPPGISNKVLALVKGDPQALARRARDAMRERLQTLWEETVRDRRALVDPNALSSATEQLDTALDVFAAWVPCDGDASYPKAREEVERVLAARRQLHAFGQWKHQRDGVYKSSLDGARESVLPHPKADPRTSEPWKTYRIGRREELDALGLIKRTRRPPGHFVPIPTIGLAAWLSRAAREHPDALREVRQLCETELGLKPIQSRRAPPWVQAFPHDAQVLLPDRWRPYLEEHGKIEHRHRLATVVRRLHIAMGGGEPFPYVACLSADGDRMGKLIRQLANPKAHRELSQALADFAKSAQHIVEKEHCGVLVYAGGDDVLAFVSPADALACARALRSEFLSKIGSFQPEGDSRPTLSVGVGIGHVLDSLGDLLALGREAEQLAKRDRDRLAVLVARRSGRRLRASLPWEGTSALDQAARLLRKELPLGKVREVSGLLLRLPDADEPRWMPPLEGEVRRILARAEPGGGASALTAKALGLTPDAKEGYRAFRDRVEGWTAQVEIADVLVKAGFSPTQGAP